VSEQPKVSIRPFRAGDAAAVHRWFNNPEATRTLMEHRSEFTEEQAHGWVQRAIDDSGEDRKFAIEVELIGDDVRGKGVGRRAEALTIARAFDEFGAHRVYGRIPAHNEAAKRVVTSLGWRHEGTLRSHLRGEDGLTDLEVWGVLPDEFRAAAGELLE